VGTKWLWWVDNGPHEEMDDSEIRYEAHVRDVDVDLSAKAEDHIKEPDEYLEYLIEKGEFVQAMNYRVEMCNLARVRKDSDMLTRYAIYGARISVARAEVDGRTHERVSRDVEEKRAKEMASRKAAIVEESVSAEEWRMPAIGKPPKPPLWGEKPPQPEGPVSVLGTAAPAADAPLINLNALNAESSIQETQPKKPRRRYLEFGQLGGRFKPPRRPSV
jgi:hypothetical protein